MTNRITARPPTRLQEIRRAADSLLELSGKVTASTSVAPQLPAAPRRFGDRAVRRVEPSSSSAPGVVTNRSSSSAVPHDPFSLDQVIPEVEPESLSKLQQDLKIPLGILTLRISQIDKLTDVEITTSKSNCLRQFKDLTPIIQIHIGNERVFNLVKDFAIKYNQIADFQNRKGIKANYFGQDCPGIIDLLPELDPQSKKQIEGCPPVDETAAKVAVFREKFSEVVRSIEAQVSKIKKMTKDVDDSVKEAQIGERGEIEEKFTQLCEMIIETIENPETFQMLTVFGSSFNWISEWRNRSKDRSKRAVSFTHQYKDLVKEIQSKLSAEQMNQFHELIREPKPSLVPERAAVSMSTPPPVVARVPRENQQVIAPPVPETAAQKKFYEKLLAVVTEIEALNKKVNSRKIEGKFLTKEKFLLKIRFNQMSSQIVETIQSQKTLDLIKRFAKCFDDISTFQGASHNKGKCHLNLFAQVCDPSIIEAIRALPSHQAQQFSAYISLEREPLQDESNPLSSCEKKIIALNAQLDRGQSLSDRDIVLRKSTILTEFKSHEKFIVKNINNEDTFELFKSFGETFNEISRRQNAKDQAQRLQFFSDACESLIQRIKPKLTSEQLAAVEHLINRRANLSESVQEKLIKFSEEMERLPPILSQPDVGPDGKRSKARGVARAKKGTLFDQFCTQGIHIRGQKNNPVIFDLVKRFAIAFDQAVDAQKNNRTVSLYFFEAARKTLNMIGFSKEQMDELKQLRSSSREAGQSQPQRSIAAEPSTRSSSSSSLAAPGAIQQESNVLTPPPAAIRAAQLRDKLGKKRQRSLPVEEAEPSSDQMNLAQPHKRRRLVNQGRLAEMPLPKKSALESLDDWLSGMKSTLESLKSRLEEKRIQRGYLVQRSSDFAQHLNQQAELISSHIRSPRIYDLVKEILGSLEGSPTIYKPFLTVIREKLSQEKYRELLGDVIESSTQIHAAPLVSEEEPAPIEAVQMEESGGGEISDQEIETDIPAPMEEVFSFVPTLQRTRNPPEPAQSIQPAQGGDSSQGGLQILPASIESQFAPTGALSEILVQNRMQSQEREWARSRSNSPVPAPPVIPLLRRTAKRPEPVQQSIELPRPSSPAPRILMQEPNASIPQAIQAPERIASPLPQQRVQQSLAPLVKGIMELNNAVRKTPQEVTKERRILLGAFIAISSDVVENISDPNVWDAVIDFATIFDRIQGPRFKDVCKDFVEEVRTKALTPEQRAALAPFVEIVSSQPIVFRQSLEQELSRVANKIRILSDKINERNDFSDETLKEISREKESISTELKNILERNAPRLKEPDVYSSLKTIAIDFNSLSKGINSFGDEYNEPYFYDAFARIIGQSPLSLDKVKHPAIFERTPVRIQISDSEEDSESASVGNEAPRPMPHKQPVVLECESEEVSLTDHSPDIEAHPPQSASSSSQFEAHRSRQLLGSERPAPMPNVAAQPQQSASSSRKRVQSKRPAPAPTVEPPKKRSRVDSSPYVEAQQSTSSPSPLGLSSSRERQPNPQTTDEGPMERSSISTSSSSSTTLLLSNRAETAIHTIESKATELENFIENNPDWFNNPSPENNQDMRDFRDKCRYQKKQHVSKNGVFKKIVASLREEDWKAVASSVGRLAAAYNKISGFQQRCPNARGIEFFKDTFSKIATKVHELLSPIEREKFDILAEGLRGPNSKRPNHTQYKTKRKQRGIGRVRKDAVSQKGAESVPLSSEAPRRVLRKRPENRRVLIDESESDGEDHESQGSQSSEDSSTPTPPKGAEVRPFRPAISASNVSENQSAQGVESGAGNESASIGQAVGQSGLSNSLSVQQPISDSLPTPSRAEISTHVSPPQRQSSDVSNRNFPQMNPITSSFGALSPSLDETVRGEDLDWHLHPRPTALLPPGYPGFENGQFLNGWPVESRKDFPPDSPLSAIDAESIGDFFADQNGSIPPQQPGASLSQSGSAPVSLPPPPLPPLILSSFSTVGSWSVPSQGIQMLAVSTSSQSSSSANVPKNPIRVHVEALKKVNSDLNVGLMSKNTAKKDIAEVIAKFRLAIAGMGAEGLAGVSSDIVEFAKVYNSMGSLHISTFANEFLELTRSFANHEEALKQMLTKYQFENFVLKGRIEPKNCPDENETRKMMMLQRASRHGDLKNPLRGLILPDDLHEISLLRTVLRLIYDSDSPQKKILNQFPALKEALFTLRPKISRLSLVPDAFWEKYFTPSP